MLYLDKIWNETCPPNEHGSKPVAEEVNLDPETEEAYRRMEKK